MIHGPLISQNEAQIYEGIHFIIPHQCLYISCPSQEVRINVEIPDTNFNIGTTLKGYVILI